ncbi:FecR domain-containing protein [uncultured Sphingomonas sp.]|uniref:FecR family protein n=1 Tax=uncultured Sphingomonas sp. TaxID=158754 RepID=UPI0035CC3797
MTDDAPDIIDQAIVWHLRQDTMPAAAWPTFVAWLEEHPDHARAYDAVARQDRLVAAVAFPRPLAMPAAANDRWPPRRRWLAATGGAGLAAAVALWVVPSSFGPGPAQVFATRDGERRSMTLADGTQVAMNGGTTLRVEGGGRAVRLDRGEVMLRVVHDPRAPFRLHAGDVEIEDVGTRFDVVRLPHMLSVAVAEGVVALRRSGTAVRLQQGEAAAVDLRTGAVTRDAVPPDSVGGWQAGLLSFDGAPLADVAAALRRRDGLNLALEGDLSRQPFTGIVRPTGAADRDVPHLADLIGATWRRDGNRWVLAARSGATR